MRPVYDYAGWQTWDLTEAKMHFATPTGGGPPTLIAFIPSKWEKVNDTKMNVGTHIGQMGITNYRVLEWDEVEAATGTILAKGVKAPV